MEEALKRSILSGELPDPFLLPPSRIAVSQIGGWRVSLETPRSRNSTFSYNQDWLATWSYLSELQLSTNSQMDTEILISFWVVFSFIAYNKKTFVRRSSKMRGQNLSKQKNGICRKLRQYRAQKIVFKFILLITSEIKEDIFMKH
jgi:hypothetical protein